MILIKYRCVKAANKNIRRILNEYTYNCEPSCVQLTYFEPSAFMYTHVLSLLFILVPIQAVSDFTFTWSCVESRDAKTSKQHQGCMLEDGSVLKDLGAESSSTFKFKPSQRKLRPNTLYTFKVSVRSTIGAPGNAFTRSFINIVFVTKSL